MRRRLLAAAIGAGVLLAALPALAEVDSGPSQADPAEAEAVALLERAAQAGRRLSYTGTQYVASWRAGGTDTALVELHHDPVSGVVVTDAQGAPAAASTAALDPRMVVRLARSYDLAVSGEGRCAGRAAAVVEARRVDGHVAGRFWVDRATGMLLRREVFDEQGTRVRSSAFVDVAVEREATEPPPLALRAGTGTEAPLPQTLQRLRGQGWPVPADLPGAFRLLETRRDDRVLHLAYTDGLSTLSLFVQRGMLGTAPMSGFVRERVDGRPVWMRRAAPSRAVWSGDGHVWTLVSDAPEDAVRAAVAALPRDRAEDSGLRSRLGRGLSRLGAILNPFD